VSSPGGDFRNERETITKGPADQDECLDLPNRRPESIEARSKGQQPWRPGSRFSHAVYLRDGASASYAKVAVTTDRGTLWKSG
jgi:hypothetical protein